MTDDTVISDYISTKFHLIILDKEFGVSSDKLFDDGRRALHFWNKCQGFINAPGRVIQAEFIGIVKTIKLVRTDIPKIIRSMWKIRQP